MTNKEKEAVKTLRDVRKYFSGGKLTTTNNDDICDALTFAIEALKDKWIPCSETERLPENEVLCCDVHQTLMIGYVFTSEKSNTGYSAESECEYMFDCVAWMPLPEPWKGDTEWKR